MTSKSSLKKTALRKSKAPRKSRIFLIENNDQWLFFSFYCGNIAGIFRIEKHELDWDFHVETGKFRFVSYNEISKEQLRKMVEPLNLINLKGARRKKAEQTLKAWARIEEFFSI